MANARINGFLKPKASVAINRTLMALATPAARNAEGD
jgi:hypothetical protein